MKGVDEKEYLAPGHRACAGCGATIAVRLALKALGENTIAVSATGCLEVITTPYPETAWEIPWIHVAFENASAVASGVEGALRAQGKEDLLLLRREQWNLEVRRRQRSSAQVHDSRDCVRL